MKKLVRLENWAKVTPKIINEIIDKVNWLCGTSVSGGISFSETASGPSYSTKTNKGNVFRRVKTQTAAGAYNYIPVKFVDSSGTEYGDQFNAYAFFYDGATKVNQCLPDVQTGVYADIYKDQFGVWILNITFTKFTECA